MSIRYRLVQSFGDGVCRQQLFKIFATMITLDDFNCIRDLSDGFKIDLLCSSLGLLVTLTWSQYPPTEGLAVLRGIAFSPRATAPLGSLLREASEVTTSGACCVPSKSTYEYRSGTTTTPGTVRQRTRPENVEVTGDVGNSGLFHDFHGKRVVSSPTVHTSASSPIFRKCLRELGKLCGTRRILPTLHVLSPCHLNIASDPFAFGGYGDAYEGTLDGSSLSVCIKRVRVDFLVLLAAQRKARCGDGMTGYSSSFTG